jgi:hypothetical protein
MAPGGLRAWREERGRHERARDYVASLLKEPPDALVLALAEAGDGDADHARWELRYQRRVVGMLVAARDALDDQTSSDVASALERALHSDPNIAPARRGVAERQLNDRLRDYRKALTDRTEPGTTPERLGRVLLAFARARTPTPGSAALATEIAATTLADCNRALRDAYGEANLPPDLPPSRVRTT